MRARFDDKIVFAIIDLVELGGVLVLVVTGRLYVICKREMQAGMGFA